ncbi:MAG: hypothetical protein QOH92_505, partial [Chloroflexota bacterium]|nr:hypothetical protein [Chloroflexota bacterium]
MAEPKTKFPSPSGGGQGGGQLVVFALGTFHAAVLIVALVLVLYAAGGLAPLLSSLSTIAGLALFCALWLTTV